ncbi:MAG: EI24 domain-containing protein, partial [Cytophagaceae bacterium]
MKFINGFGKGVASFFSSIPFIFEKGLWHYLFYPVILWLILIAVTLFAGIEFSKWLHGYVSEWLSLDSIPDSGHWLSWAKGIVSGYLSIIISWLLSAVVTIISGTFIKYLILIILSPLFSLLSESTEEAVTGQKFAFSFRQLFKDIGRSVLINSRNMLFEYACIFLGFVICLAFPFMFVIITPLTLLIGWYFIGYSMLDYSCERDKMGVIASIRFVRQ